MNGKVKSGGLCVLLCAIISRVPVKQLDGGQLLLIDDGFLCVEGLFG